MRQKGQALIWIIVGVLVIAAVAGGAYYLGKQTTPKPSPNPVVTPQTSQPVIGALSNNTEISSVPSFRLNIAGRTEGWKTATYPKYGFSISYPADWPIKEFTTPTSYSSFPGNTIMFNQTSYTEKASENASVEIYQVPENVSLDSFLSNSGAQPKSAMTYVKVIVDGYQGFLVSGLPRCCAGQDIYIKKGSRIYHLGNNVLDSMYDLDDVKFFLMVSSFKFLQ